MVCFNLRSTISATLASCALAAFVLSASPAPARADDQGGTYDVGVARISVLNGSVSIKRGDSGDTVAAMINAPVNVGDYITTYGDARAELQVSSSDFVRVDAETQLRFTSLGSQANSLQLAQGTIEVRSLQSSQDTPSVQTPSVTIRPNISGRYRVEVTADGDTLLAVRSGNADVVAAQNTQTIYAGSTVSISGGPSNPQISLIPNLSRDAFDDWNSDRDRYLAAASRDPYADSGIVGLADLDTYGRWVDYPDYGRVWVAYNYPAGWAPYRYGRWAWEPYYGWTWVGYEPWGWAPYHYGRWFYAPSYGWAWYPGPVYVRPVYQPALVAFFGFGGGGGFSFSFTFGNVCWVPLAPYEPYYPWWGPRYVNNTTIVYNNYTNITNITNINNVNVTKIYRNANAPGGVAIVNHENFMNGGQYKYLAVHSNELHNVALVRNALPVVPTKQNLSFNNRDNEHAIGATQVSSRFNKLPTPAQMPLTFEQQRANVQTVVKHGEAAPHVNNGRPAATDGNLHADNGSAHTNTVSRTVTSPWDRFNANVSETSGSTMHAPHLVNSAVNAPAATDQAANGAGHTNIIRNTSSSPWDRFNGTNQTAQLPRGESQLGNSSTHHNYGSSPPTNASSHTNIIRRATNSPSDKFDQTTPAGGNGNGYSRPSGGTVYMHPGQYNGSARTYSGRYSTNSVNSGSGPHNSNGSSGGSHGNGGHNHGG